jgi:hypothetical protein
VIPAGSTYFILVNVPFTKIKQAQKSTPKSALDKFEFFHIFTLKGDFMNKDNTIIFLCQKIEALYKAHSDLTLRGTSGFEKRLAKLVHSEIMSTYFEIEKILISSPKCLG